MKQKFQITRLTNVQEKSIPAILTDQDVIVKSQTGSGKFSISTNHNFISLLGKTLAYVIPIVHRIQMIEPLVRRETGPIAIVLVPTKEVISFLLINYESFIDLLACSTNV